MSPALSTTRPSASATMEQDVVREIQARFDSPRCAGWSGAQVAVRRVPGIGFGGDFHNVLHGPDDRFSIVVGTVRHAGLMGAFAKAVLAGEVARLGAAPTTSGGLWDCLSTSIDRLNADMRDGVQCSVFHAVVDRQRNRFEYRSAGAVIPVALTTGCRLLDMGGDRIALGHATRPPTEPCRVDLRGLLRLIVCTEGFVGAASPEGRPLLATIGLETFARTAHLTPDEQADVLIRRLREHVGEHCVFTEDATVFIVDFAPAEREHDADSAGLLWRSYTTDLGAAADSSIFIG